MRILHVTEAMASGTLQVLAQLAHAQVADGNVVHVAHSIRKETPSAEKLAAMLPGAATRENLPFVTEISPIRDLVSAVQLARIIARFRPDIVHAHSSKAGAIARLVCWARRSPALCYSPHGFAFLREDISESRRLLFQQAEALLARMCGTIIACSNSEGDLAKNRLRAKQVVVVDNAIDLTAIPVHGGNPSTPLTITTSGRLSYQKAPWRFAELARALADTGARFQWMGDGDVSLMEQDGQPRPANLEITGWLDRRELLARLANADVYVLLSLWEGMPLVLIEAQAVGLPAVVTDIAGSRDVMGNEQTGFICAQDSQWISRVRQLIADSALRAKMGKAARQQALLRFSLERQHRQVMQVYASCLRGRR